MSLKAAVFALIACALLGCQGPSATNRQTADDAATQSQSASQGQTSPAPSQAAPVPPEIPFEADISILGDPPEGEIDVFEAQALLADYVVQQEDAALLASPGLFYIYRGIEEYESREYYRIDLCARTVSHKEPEVLHEYLAGGDQSLFSKGSDGAWLRVAESPGTA